MRCSAPRCVGHPVGHHPVMWRARGGRRTGVAHHFYCVKHRPREKPKPVPLQRIADVPDLPRMFLPALKTPWAVVPRKPNWSLTAWQAVAVAEIAKRLEAGLASAADPMPPSQLRFSKLGVKNAWVPGFYTLEIGDYIIDCSAWKVTHPVVGEIKLTPGEFQLFAYLADHAGQLVTTAELRRVLWGDAADKASRNTVQVLISTLRRKVALVIETRRGVGYILEKPDEHPAAAS